MADTPRISRSSVISLSRLVIEEIELLSDIDLCKGRGRTARRLEDGVARRHAAERVVQQVVVNRNDLNETRSCF